MSAKLVLKKNVNIELPCNPMDKFYLNNSSLPYLNCSLQYYLTVRKGLTRPPWSNTYLAIGLAFHELMQQAKVGDQLALKGLLPPEDGTKFAAISPADRAKVAIVADKLLREHPEMYGPDSLRESWFTIELPFPGKPVPHLCGTVDHRMLIDDTLVITDYKTTKKKLDADLAASYQLTFQRWFYIIATLLDESLPPLYRAAADNLKIAFRYCFVSYDTAEYILQPVELINIDELHAARKLLADKVGLAQAILADETLAVPEGITNGACYSCPFKLICLSPAEDRVKHIDNWYLGNKPYYPKHD